MTKDEVEAARIHLGLSKRHMRRMVKRTKYNVNGVRKYSSAYDMSKRKDNSCVFLEDNLCSLQDAKPHVCRDYKMNGPDCVRVFVNKNSSVTPEFRGYQ